MKKCPCGSQQSFDACCGQYISGNANAPTPEALMRSRYSAYVMGDAAYIAKTQTGKAAADFDEAYIKAWSQQAKWHGLRVMSAHESGNKGQVEFMAFYELNNSKSHMHEVSEFVKESDQWFYADGKFVKTGRNDACPCGSGKKFKKCCGQ